MDFAKLKPGNLNVDINTIGAVFGILSVIAANVGGVVGSGALHDQSGSSRGASMQVITPTPAVTAPATEETSENEPAEDYLSPAIREHSKHAEDLASKAEEFIRRQFELNRQSEELLGRADDFVRQADEMIRQREAAGLY